MSSLRLELTPLMEALEVGVAASPGVVVRDAAPREVFVQALTLFDKADQLAFEHTRVTRAPPTQPAHQPRPADVLGVVEAARARIRTVAERMGLPAIEPEVERNPEHTPTDVLASIMNANRTLNSAVARATEPGDVFERVTAAVGYAARLLALHPEVRRIPDAPAFEPARRPADVLRRLGACLDIVRRLAADRGLSQLEVDLSMLDDELVVPSDVLDLAALLVYELSQLHASHPEVGPPLRAYHPGTLTPSHVYQRAGVLLAQLRLLAELSRVTP